MAVILCLSPGADVRRGWGRDWANADEGGEGSILANILRTFFMDDTFDSLYA